MAGFNISREDLKSLIDGVFDSGYSCSRYMPNPAFARMLAVVDSNFFHSLLMKLSESELLEYKSIRRLDEKIDFVFSKFEDK